MAKKVNISVPDNLHEKMEKYKEGFNYSKMFQKMISEAIAKKELFLTKLEEEIEASEIIEKADMNSGTGQFELGKELGFIFAKQATYRTLRKVADVLIKNWDEGKEVLFENVIELIDSISSVLSKIDVLGLEISNEHELKKILSESPDSIFPLLPEFDIGVVEGVILFINEEYQKPPHAFPSRKNVGKIYCMKDEDNKLRLFHKKK